MSDERIEAPSTPNKILNPLKNYVGTKARVKFSGEYLKQKKFTFNHGKLVNIYIVYEIEKSVNIRRYPTLENCLFDTAKLTKHVDVDQYKYWVYGIGFDREGFFSHAFGRTGKNIIIFGIDMSLLTKIDKRKQKTF